MATSTTSSRPPEELKEWTEPDDPCNSFEWSIIFFLILVLALVFIGLEAHCLYKRRSELFSGFDIGAIFLFVCTIIQFGPMTSHLLQAGHDFRSFTQSGCKLIHYTEYGIRHVILAILLGLILYAWLITKHNFNQEQVDKRVRRNLPWLILLAFAIEGLFGMPIAIYVDVLPNFPNHCVWSPTLKLTPAEIIALEVAMRPLIPYLIPAILLPLPLIELRKTLISVEGQKLKSQIQSIISLGWAYIILNVPYSIVFLAHYAAMWNGDIDKMTTICNFQWFFFLFHQFFFVFVPCLMLKHEVKVENPPVGNDILNRILDKISLLAAISIRDDRTELM